METMSNFTHNTLLATVLTGSIGALSYAANRVRERVLTVGNVQRAAVNFESSMKPIYLPEPTAKSEKIMNTISGKWDARETPQSEVDSFMSDWVNGSWEGIQNARSYSNSVAQDDIRTVSTLQRRIAANRASWTRLTAEPLPETRKPAKIEMVSSTMAIDTNWIDEWIGKPVTEAIEITNPMNRIAF